ncbi:hypothetical protein J2S06_001654 [Bacillus alveayuensis]|uniref:Uncharacterized protein n=1 Tax=Aeribacillus alveayuensis TaxID=279215 RepID=A0ABT9VNM0_9BACI|nr:hypothetical protein [Bacillus alveayuensis]
MEEKTIKQEEFLKILLNAYVKGETLTNLTTKELLQFIEFDIKRMYAS